jgi:hypothetical protein
MKLFYSNIAHPLHVCIFLQYDTNLNTIYTIMQHTSIVCKSKSYTQYSTYTCLNHAHAACDHGTVPGCVIGCVLVIVSGCTDPVLSFELCICINIITFHDVPRPRTRVNVCFCSRFFSDYRLVMYCLLKHKCVYVCIRICSRDRSISSVM